MRTALPPPAAAPGPEPPPAWGACPAREPHWPAALAVVATMGLYLALPNKLTLGPNWLIPALEAAVLVPLTITARHRHPGESPLVRKVALGLVGLVSLANALALQQLVRLLLHPGRGLGLLRVHGSLNGRELIVSAIMIWLTNVVVFGLWYWELDRGGPAARCRLDHREPDFLFPQMATPEAAPPGWTPSFLDYLYVSFTNSAAFSPTDTMPLTAWAKGLMLVQSLVSLLTVALVAARAVNILG